MPKQGVNTVTRLLVVLLLLLPVSLAALVGCESEKKTSSSFCGQRSSETLSRARASLVVLVAAACIFVPLTLMHGYDSAFADVGSIADGEDISYDKNGGVLASMGFDTSKMPDTYDADATTNPYGSDVSTLREVAEGVWFDMTSDETPGRYHFPDPNLYGHNKK